MRSYVGWRGERINSCKGVKASPYQTRFKNLEGKPGTESSKRTIYASGGLGPLQLVSKLDTRRCASKDVGLLRGVDCETPHRLERGMKHYL